MAVDAWLISYSLSDYIYDIYEI